MRAVRRVVVSKPPLVFQTKKIKSLVESGNIAQAKALLEELKLQRIQPDAVLYSTLLKYYAVRHDLSGAHSIYKEMVTAGVKPDVRTYNVLGKMHLDLADVEGAKQWISSMKSDGINPTIVTYTQWLKFFVDQENEEGTTNTLREMEMAGIHPDKFTFSVLIKQRIANNNIEGAIDIIDQMVKAKIPPHCVPISRIIKALVQSQQIERAKELLHKVIAAGSELDFVVFRIPLRHFVATQDLNEASCFLSFIHRTRPDILKTYEFFTGCVNVNHSSTEIRFLAQAFLKSTASTCLRSCNSLMELLAEWGEMQSANQLLEQMSAAGIRPNVSTFTSLAKLFASEDFDKAMQVLRVMSDSGTPTIFPYHELIRHCAAANRPENASLVIREMMRVGLTPTSETLSCLQVNPRLRDMAQLDMILTNAGLPGAAISRLFHM